MGAIEGNTKEVFLFAVRKVGYQRIYIVRHGNSLALDRVISPPQLQSRSYGTRAGIPNADYAFCNVRVHLSPLLIHSAKNVIGQPHY